MLKLAFIFIIAGVSYAAYWHYYGQYQESTDNAYVVGNLIRVEPQAKGAVISILVDDTDFVEAGGALVTLDSTDSAIALEKAKAVLAESARQVSRLFRKVEKLEAMVALRESEVAGARDEYQRRKALVAKKAVSKEDYDRARTNLRTAEQAHRVAKSELAETHALVWKGGVEDHPSVKLAAEKLRQAYVAYRRAVIVAPVSGYIAKRSVQIGQIVGPGKPLMAIVPLDQIWVEANFKESQLENMRVGQPVKLTSDMYGKDTEFKGRVAGLGAGTGSVFSILPPQNATGNWIKIVQRVPVRIKFEPGKISKRPLILGLSMKAAVDTHDRSGESFTAAKSPSRTYKTDVYKTQIDGAEELIGRIISGNQSAAGKK